MKPNPTPNLLARRAALLEQGFRENSKGELVKWLNETSSRVVLYPYKDTFIRNRQGKQVGPARTIVWDSDGQPLTVGAIAAPRQAAPHGVRVAA